MRKFIIEIFWFILILLILAITGIFLPCTPRASKSLLQSSFQKDSLIENTKSDRIIFIGGSNLSFGLNSQMIKDSLNLNPINTGIHAGIGLVYMMKSALEYIRKGDIVILVPEYQHFYSDFAYGEEGEELTRIIFDTDISKTRLLNPRQLKYVIMKVPKYAFSKYSPREYFKLSDDIIYSVGAFNEYGDADKHWEMERKEFFPYGDFDSTKFNINVLEKIKEFQMQIKEKEAELFITYPGYQDSSFLNAKKQINKIERYLKQYNFNIIATPERYVMPTNMTFDTPYHLTRIGADYRTKMFIEDFKRSYSQPAFSKK